MNADPNISSNYLNSFMKYMVFRVNYDAILELRDWRITHVGIRRTGSRQGKDVRDLICSSNHRVFGMQSAQENEEHQG